VPEKGKPKRSSPPPLVGTVVAVRWIDSGCSHHRTSVEPSEAILGVAVTTGELVGWHEDASSPEKRVCVIRTAYWLFPNNTKLNTEDDRDLFSIWIPSIIEITEYMEVKRGRKA